MKLAYVTVHDASDPRAFGGRAYYMTDALKARSEAFDYIGPLSKLKYRLLLASKARTYTWLLRKQYYANRDALFIKDCAKQVSIKLKHS